MLQCLLYKLITILCSRTVTIYLLSSTNTNQLHQHQSATPSPISFTTTNQLHHHQSATPPPISSTTTNQLHHHQSAPPPPISPTTTNQPHHHQSAPPTHANVNEDLILSELQVVSKLHFLLTNTDLINNIPLCQIKL